MSKRLKCFCSLAFSSAAAAVVYSTGAPVVAIRASYEGNEGAILPLCVKACSTRARERTRPRARVMSEPSGARSAGRRRPSSTTFHQASR